MLKSYLIVDLNLTICMVCYLDVLKTAGDTCIDDMFQALFKSDRFNRMNHSTCSTTLSELRDGMKSGDRFDNPEK